MQRRHVQRLRSTAVLLCVLLSPALAWAQASIVGQVRDDSGGVLPGVNVAASSPALIEISGREFERRRAGVFRAHEDARRPSRLFRRPLPALTLTTRRRSNALTVLIAIVAPGVRHRAHEKR
jgi:hypothetical protein